MSRDIDLDNRQAVLLRPGDLLILGNVGSDLDVGALSSAAQALKEELDLASVVIFESDVTLSSIGAEEIARLMSNKREADE